jgi:hypothetical protein
MLLGAGLAQRRHGFAPGSLHSEFVLDKVALGQDFLQVLWFHPVYIISPWLSMLIYHMGDEQWPQFGGVVSPHLREQQQQSTGIVCTLTPWSKTFDKLIIVQLFKKSRLLWTPNVYFLLKFRIVFWDVLPCKIIVDRRFRGTYCLHTHPWWWRQHAAVRTWNLTRLLSCSDEPTFSFFRRIESISPRTKHIYKMY